MRKFISKSALFTMVLVVSGMFFLSSCNEDVVDPSSTMPPKNTIRTPPEKE